MLAQPRRVAAPRQPAASPDGRGRNKWLSGVAKVMAGISFLIMKAQKASFGLVVAFAASVVVAAFGRGHWCGKGLYPLPIQQTRGFYTSQPKRTRS